MRGMAFSDGDGRKIWEFGKVYDNGQSMKQGRQVFRLPAFEGC